VFKEMLSKGIEPSVATFNAVVDACARNARMDVVPQLLEDMQARNLKPNLITYSTIIKGFCQRGDIPAALSALEDLHSKELKPDEIVYNTLLDGCAQAGIAKEGERLLAEMQKKGIAPSNYTLTVAIRLMALARNLDRAFELTASLTEKYRFKANSQVYCALIQACTTCKESSRAMTVFEQMVKERMQPDPRTCQILFRALFNVGNLKKCADVLRTAIGFVGAQRPGGERQGDRAQQFDSAFFDDALRHLADSGNEGSALALPLLADLRSAAPKVRIDATLERKLMKAANW